MRYRNPTLNVLDIHRHADKIFRELLSEFSTALVRVFTNHLIYAFNVTKIIPVILAYKYFSLDIWNFNLMFFHLEEESTIVFELNFPPFPKQKFWAQWSSDFMLIFTLNDLSFSCVMQDTLGGYYDSVRCVKCAYWYSFEVVEEEQELLDHDSPQMFTLG